MRSIQFVGGGDTSSPAEPLDDAALPPVRKRAKTERAPDAPLALERFVRTGRFEVLVADPRPTDIFSQSLSFTASTHRHMQADASRCG
eukprot:7226649-Prymnesium_polylepis.1